MVPKMTVSPSSGAWTREVLGQGEGGGSNEWWAIMCTLPAAAFKNVHLLSTFETVPPLSVMITLPTLAPVFPFRKIAAFLILTSRQPFQAKPPSLGYLGFTPTNYDKSPLRVVRKTRSPVVRVGRLEQHRGALVGVATIDDCLSFGVTLLIIGGGAFHQGVFCAARTSSLVMMTLDSVFFLSAVKMAMVMLLLPVLLP